MSYPSVTQVLSPWVDYSRVPPELLEAAGKRGRLVHRCCAAHLMNLWTAVPDGLEGYFRSFLAFSREHIAEVVLVEAALDHPTLLYQGHPDLFCRLKGDRGLAVVDWKTPLAYSQAWRLQLAGYRELGRYHGHDIVRNLSIRLKADGRIPLVNDSTETHHQDFAVFMNALSVWRFFHGF
jgi:hypothetical protein